MTNRKIARRTGEKAPKEGNLTLSPHDKILLLELLKSWRGVEEQLRLFSARQAAQKDYLVAAENYMLAEGMTFCIGDLAKMISDSN